jgi:hypothetical protein
MQNVLNAISAFNASTTAFIHLHSEEQQLVASLATLSSGCSLDDIQYLLNTIAVYELQPINLDFENVNSNAQRLAIALAAEPVAYVNYKRSVCNQIRSWFVILEARVTNSNMAAAEAAYDQFSNAIEDAENDCIAINNYISALTVPPLIDAA